MYTNNSGIIPEVIQKAFSKSLEVYPSSYKPELRVVDGYYPGTVRCNLPLEEKAMLFHAYCYENKKVGTITTSNVSMQQFALTNGAQLLFVTVTADVLIDDKMVGSAVAGQQCFLDNFHDMDSIVQYASGIAKSRALSNAGFGIISGSDFDASGAEQNSSGLTPGMQTPPTQQPVTSNHSVPASTDASKNVAGNASAAQQKPAQGKTPPPVSPQPNAQMTIPGTMPPSADPVEAAKNVICDMRGPDVNGKRMGDILTANPKKIIYIAETWKGNGPVKEAAKVLLEEAKKYAGVKR